MHVETAARPHADGHTGTLVRGTCVRVSGDAARVGVPGQPPHAPGDATGPRIELVRKGDVIEAIDIVCGCGQHIRLHCVYQEAP